MRQGECRREARGNSKSRRARERQGDRVRAEEREVGRVREGVRAKYRGKDKWRKRGQKTCRDTRGENDSEYEGGE